MGDMYPVVIGLSWCGTLVCPSGNLLLGDPEAVGTDGGLEMNFGVPELKVGVRLSGQTVVELVIARARHLVMRRREKPVGTLWVDTAKVIAFDASYLPRWDPRGRAKFGTTYIDQQGTHWHCALHEPPPPCFRGRTFPRYDTPLPEFGGRAMNVLEKSREVTRNDWALNEREFSVAGAWAALGSVRDVGWLDLDGMPAATVCTSGLGDGEYEVYADRYANGKVKSLSVRFL